MSANRQAAFSLIELMITIAIVGIVSAAAIPVYRDYINTANMSKVNSAYDNAVRFARQEWSKSTTRAFMGLPPTVPQSNKGWVEAIDTDVEAPGGGPIYVPYGAPNVDEVGAVMFEAHPSKGFVYIYRPAYLDLQKLRAKVTADDVEVTEL